MYSNKTLTARNCKEESIRLTSQHEKITGAYFCAENVAGQISEVVEQKAWNRIKCYCHINQ